MEDSSSKPEMEGGEPTKPDHSLPSYNEPTPETHRKITREEEAELALKKTILSRGATLLLIAGFLATVCAVPLIQFFSELRQTRAGGGLPMFGIFQPLPGWTQIRAVRNPVADVWNLLPRRKDLKAAEKGLEDQSVVSQWLLPRVQTALTGALGVGNEQACVGRDGWLFYRPERRIHHRPRVFRPRGNEEARGEIRAFSRIPFPRSSIFAINFAPEASIW